MLMDDIFKKEKKTIDQIHQEVRMGKTNETATLYNGFSFVKLNNLWYSQVQTQGTLLDISFEYHPTELEDIGMEKLSKQFYNLENIYITFNPDDEGLQYVAVAAGKLTLGLSRAGNIMPLAACTKNITEPCQQRPIVSCDNAPDSVAVIQLEQAEKTSIEIKRNCVLITGKDKELTRAAERFLMGMYGIIFMNQTEEEIKQEIDNANYCTTADDCEFVGGKCPFGCNIYVNRNESSRIDSMIKGFDSDCAYKCILSERVDCIEGECEARMPQMVGGDIDEHGCIGSAGYTWCEAKQKCLRTWEEPCEDNTTIVGGDKDEHGCIGSAGYVWCEPKQKCLRIWEEPCEPCSKEGTEFSMEYSEAKLIVQEKCNMTLKDTYMCNNVTGTWWIDVESDKEGCAPACVVDVETKAAEINWRCTGAVVVE